MSVELRIPLPPRSKQRPRFAGHAYMQDAYSAWKADVGWHVAGSPGLPLAGRLRISAEWRFPREPRGDTDNLLGGLLDALTGIAYEDDAQVREIGLVRWVPSDEKVMAVLLEPAGKYEAERPEIEKGQAI